MTLTKEELKEKYETQNYIILGILLIIILIRIISGFILGQELLGNLGGGILIMLVGLILPVILFIYISKYDTIAYIALAVFTFIGGGDSAKALATTEGLTSLLIIIELVLGLTLFILAIYMLLKKHPEWNI